jgi:hypothetical protein
MDLKIYHRFASNKIYSLLLLVLSILLIMQYNVSETHKPSQELTKSSVLKDYGYWITAAQNMNAFDNPYIEDPLYKSGVFSASIFNLFKLVLVNDILFFTVMQIFNLIGLMLFIYTFLRWRVSNTVLALLLITASSTREILVNGQVTGITLGLFSISYALTRYIHNNLLVLSKLRIFAISSIAGICYFFLLDIKPNIFLFPLVVLLLAFRTWSILVSGLFLWIIHQAFFSLILGELLILSWVKNLSNVALYESNPNLFGSIGPWQILNHLTKNNFLFQYIPILLYFFAGACSVFLVKRNLFLSALFLAFSTNYFYTYFHYYTFFAIISFIMYKVLSENSPFLTGFLASTLQFSFVLSPQNMILSSMYLALICILYKSSNKSYMYFFVLGWLMSMIFRLGLTTELSSDPYLTKAIIVAIPYVIFLILSRDQIAIIISTMRRF